MKVCTSCGAQKPRSEFNVRRASKDGLNAACKVCTNARDKARNAANPERNRERARKWKEENRERVAEREREKRLANLEEYRAKGRMYAAKDKAGAKRRIKKWLSDPANQERKCQKDKEWRERNKERKAVLDKKWAQENPTRRKEIVKRYRENNPETTRLRSHIQHARSRGAPTPSPEARDYILILEQDPCCYCGAPMEDIDHIDPLALLKDTEWVNLTAACESCNSRKWKKPLLSFLLDSSPKV